MTHRLTGHALFTVDRLVALAEQLPENRRLVYSGQVDRNQIEDVAPSEQLSIGETIRRIGELKTWVGLKMITRVPEYKKLVDEILDPIQPLIEKTHPGMHDREAHLIISSPWSTTPFHMDSEHIFFIHFSGKKEFTVFDQADRELVPDEALERHHTRVNRRMVLRDEHVSRGVPFLLAPGDAVHVPVLAPHLVRTFDEPCLSMTVTFRTPDKDRRALVYRVNHLMRARGMSPGAPGRSRFADTAKVALFNAKRRLANRGRLPEESSSY